MARPNYSDPVPPAEKREQQLNLALRQAGLTAFDWDLVRGRVSWAGCHQQMFGITVEEQLNDTYEHLLSFVHPEDVVRVDQVSRDLVTRGDSYSIEYRIVRPDGELRWVSGTGEVERDEHGMAVRVVGVIRDITPAKDADRQQDRARDLLYQLLQGHTEREALIDTLCATAPIGLAWREIADRKQAVEALRKSEERLRLSTSAAGVGVFEWDLSSDTPTWENDRMFEIFGHSQEDGPASRADFFARYLLPEDIEPFSRALTEAVQARQAFKTTSRCVRKDGALRWLEFAGEFEFAGNGMPHRMIGVVTDITERRQAEAALQRLYALTDAALAQMDKETLLSELLARVRQLLSTDSAQILLLSADGTTLSVAAGDGPRADDGNAGIPVGQGFAGRIASSGAPLIVHNTGEVSVLNPLLRDRLTSVMGVPLFVEGRLIGVLHTGTARARHFDDQDLSLLQAAADRAALAIEHARLYDEARTLIDQLQRSNAVKDELLGLVSHELRTPMTTIMGTVEVLAQRFETLDAASREAAFSELRNDAARLQRIIQNMLILARGDSLWQTDPEPVMLQHVLREVVQGEQRRDDSRLLILDMPPGLPPVLASVGYLEQILENLLTNARKYGTPGTSIEIRALCEDEMVAVTVADRGPILTEDEVAQFFEPFYRSQRVKNRTGGTGLGMSVCRRLVEVLGGTIAARPREGGGLEVTFSLPTVHIGETA